MPARRLLIALLFVTGLPAASADEPAGGDAYESELLYVRRIAPLLREKCLGCHGADPEVIEGSLDMRSLAAIRHGGDSGDPGLLPGDGAASAIYQAAERTEESYSAMPPKEAEALDEKQLAWLKRWIDTGAVWPSDERRKELEESFADAWSAEDGITVKTSGGLAADWTDRKYDPAGLWAYQPVQKPAVAVDGRSSVDQLIEQRLPEGLAAAPRADRRTLIRRATFDLTGLPPTPEDVDAFVADARSGAEAFAEVVDRLLASPHYGERMAQHWLDVTRYADSSGFANDYERGNAWRYRDYVVRSFNDDKPYDQFVREQIAGDELDPDNPEMLVATGFLRMGPWELTGMEVAKVARQRFLDDVTNSVGETFLGHSLQCARCHDHKFDPVPTRDYYSIQAVFGTTQLAERKAEFLDVENTSGFEEKRYLDKIRKDHSEQIKELDAVMLANAEVWFKENGIPSKQWDDFVSKMKAEGKGGGIFGAARNAMKKAGLSEDEYPPKLVGFTPQEFGMERVARKGMQRLSWEFDRYKPYALAVYNGRTPNMKAVYAPLRVPGDRMKKGELEQTAILGGGDPFSPTQPVQPGTLSVIDDQVSAAIPDSIEGRRAAFAKWVTDANNPLTTRVIANRLWLWHFGEGIAGNPNNFGSTGKRPTHPELLDWLAATLVEEDWSIKAMHRHIMLSDTYCRSSQHSEPKELAELDPQGTSYAAFQPRRLSAEELRDAMLAATGELNPILGGIPCRPEINQEVALQPRMVMGTFAAAWTPNPKPEQRHRRSIYVLKLRGLVAPLLEVFNAPAPDFSAEKREASTVTPQVFALFNGQNTHTRALALADRAASEADSEQAVIERCFELALARSPTEAEIEACLKHWRSVKGSLPEEAVTPPEPPVMVVREAVEENTGEKFSFEETLYANQDFQPDLRPSDVSKRVRALADVCLVLLNSNEFVYVY